MFQNMISVKYVRLHQLGFKNWFNGACFNCKEIIKLKLKLNNLSKISLQPNVEWSQDTRCEVKIELGQAAANAELP